MLMDFSIQRKGGRNSECFFPGRKGHRAARLNDSIFVLGGGDKRGLGINAVHKINCQNNRIDSIILDNVVALEGFSLFPHKNALFLWAGLRLGQHVNQLLKFDGSRFIELQQKGAIPSPRAYHCWTTFAGKYLIIFAGSDGNQFFNDWHILNLSTLVWQPLIPSLPITYSLGYSMTWVNGRGILLVNELFDLSTNTVIPNAFYQFYVSDFQKGLLNITPLQLSLSGTLFQEFVFNHMNLCDHNCLFIFGGYRFNANSELHSHSYLLWLDPTRLERGRLKLTQKSQFESVYYQNKLYVIGGYNSNSTQDLSDSLQIYEGQGQKKHYKRLVCSNCKLYYDEQWFGNSQQAFPPLKIKGQYDYNYHLRIDNRVLHKMSSYIQSQIYALTLLLQALNKITTGFLHISLRKVQNPFIIREIYRYLKITCSLSTIEPGDIINQFLMKKECSVSRENILTEDIQQNLLIMKMATLRLGSNCLLTIKTGKYQTCIIYFSSNQLDCTHSNYTPFTTHHYYYDSSTQQSSSSLQRHIIYENVRHFLPNIGEYQTGGEFQISLMAICDESLEGQLTVFQQSQETETGQTGVVSMLKEERKGVPLLQLSFLSSVCSPKMLVENVPFKFINILEMLYGDAKSNIIQRINKYDSQIGQTIEKIELFSYPSQYWFRRILIYHRGRMVMHIEQSSAEICGVLVLSEIVQMDLTFNRPCKIQHEDLIRMIVNDLTSIKRSRVF